MLSQKNRLGDGVYLEACRESRLRPPEDIAYRHSSFGPRGGKRESVLVKRNMSGALCLRAMLSFDRFVPNMRIM